MKPLFRYDFETDIHAPVRSLEIVEEEDCFYLFLLDKEEEGLGDIWGAELEDVMAQAEFNFGIEKHRWHEIKPDEGA